MPRGSSPGRQRLVQDSRETVRRGSPGVLQRDQAQQRDESRKTRNETRLAAVLEQRSLTNFLPVRLNVLRQPVSSISRGVRGPPDTFRGAPRPAGPPAPPRGRLSPGG